MPRGPVSNEYYHTLSTQELDAILSKANTIGNYGISGAGWQCYFTILRLFGKRVSEVIELRKNSVSVIDNYLNITFRIRKTRRTRPLIRTKQVNIKNPYVHYIVDYSDSMPDGYLFPSSGTKSGHIYREYAWKVCKLIDENLFNHKFRHTLATDLANKKITAFEMQSFFDWASLNMAAEYVQASGVSTQRISDLGVESDDEK